MAPSRPQPAKLNTTQRSASRSGTANLGDPGTPAAPGTPVISSSAPLLAPAPRADPLSKAAAKRLLTGQKYLDNSSDPITPSILCNLLTQFCARAEISTTTASLLMAVVVLMPDAVELGYNLNKSLIGLAEKVEGLAEQVTLLGEGSNPPDHSPKLAELEKKIELLATAVEKSGTSATAAEEAAIDSQKTMITMREQWETVPPRAGNKGPRAVTGSPDSDPAGPQMRPRPPTAKQNADTTKRLQTEGCWLLIEPTSPDVIDILNGKNPRELVQKADEAWEACWNVLLTTDFVKEQGREHRPRIVFKTATRLARGGIRYEMGDRTQAAYLSDARVALEFEKSFGGVCCRGQGAPVLLHCAPVTFCPEDEDALRALEQENQLNPGDILSARWMKAVHRRAPEQRQAVVRLELRSQELADRLITEGGQLDYARVVFKKVTLEPTRCLKCQLYGHKAAKCKGLGDICSQCGAGHRSAACDNREAKYCVSCKTDQHCSYDRACPTFRQQCTQFNQLRPENRSRFYNTSYDPRAQAPPPRPIVYSQRETLADRMQLDPAPRPPRQHIQDYFRSNRRHGSDSQEREIRIPTPVPAPASVSEPIGWSDVVPMQGNGRATPPHIPHIQYGPDFGIMQAGFRPSLPPAPASLPMRPASPLAFPVQVPRAVHPLYPIAPFNIMNRYSPSYPDISERTRLRPSSPHPRTRSASVSTVSSSTTVR